jgi:rRNA maturation protein Nop10
MYSRVAAIAALILVIVAAGWFVVTKGLPGGKAREPQWVKDQRVELIDAKSFELMAKTRGEWDALGQRNGRYKNPKIGEYTMAITLICGACGEKIPAPEAPPETGDPKAPRDAMQALFSYKCPKCGGNVYPPGRPKTATPPPAAPVPH